MDREVEQRFEKIEAILKWVAERQAAAEVRADRADDRMAIAEARMDHAEAAAAARAARAEARMARADARMDHVEAAAAARAARAEARMDRLDKRAAESDARFEKRMKGFEKLVKIGMRELAEQRRKINALIDSQQRTEASLRAFLDSRRTRNGRTR
jgi:hypothetical protein